MKNWNQPEVVELNIAETAQNIFGSHLDGGFTGDGELNGHMTFDEEKCAGKVTSKLTGKTYVCKTCYPTGYHS